MSKAVDSVDEFSCLLFLAGSSNTYGTPAGWVYQTKVKKFNRILFTAGETESIGLAVVSVEFPR